MCRPYNDSTYDTSYNNISNDNNNRGGDDNSHQRTIEPILDHHRSANPHIYGYNNCRYNER